ncbi:hypothetical protein [Streptomyces sp. NPDC001665]
MEALCAAVASRPLVNLTGPLGVGKSVVVAGLRDAVRVDLDGADGTDALRRALAESTERTVVADSVDGRQRWDALRHEIERAGDLRRNVVVVSRRPLRSDPRWTGSGVATVAMAPAPEGRIAAQAASIDDQDGRALVIGLAGGIPLVADAVRRALEAGTPCTAPGAVADQVAEELLERLCRELPGTRWRHALRLLATVGAGDERLVPGGPDHFAALSSLSIVGRGSLGLRITEPYRTVLELAYQWRRPDAHEHARVRARGYRLGRLAATRDRTERAALIEQGIFLGAAPLVRRNLFPASPEAVRVRTAADADADNIGRLMRRWALDSGFDTRRCDSLAERWAGDDISAFHIVYDRDERAIGLANLMSVDERTAQGLEPLLQQHSSVLAHGGLFLGAAHCPDPGARAQLLRRLLRQAALRDGQLIVSTANPDYQGLVDSLGFRAHGTIRDDVFRCGRPPSVYSNDFAAGALPWWLSRITGADSTVTSMGGRLAGPRLAPRELQILLDYASGMTLKSAARRAGVSLNTAKDYLKRVKAKYRRAGRPAFTKIDLAHRVQEDGLQESGGPGGTGVE